MYKNRSPWIHQLNPDRVAVVLSGDVHTDIAIIGAGIAGVATAFFALKNTTQKITIFEGGRLAHGATGHNGGQLTSYFERPLAELAEEFGAEMVARGQQDVEMAWELLDEMYTEAGLDIPLSRFTGYAGITSLSRVLLHLEECRIRKNAGLVPEEFWIAKNASFLDSIPKIYDDLYSLVPQQKILDKLEVSDARFIAMMSAQKGCMNSALFCQEIVEYLKKQYGKRFALYEHAFIRKIVLKKSEVLLDAGNATISASKVVLCTNGFEHFSIFDISGLEINSRFHHSVFGLVGFLSAYLTDYSKPPMALSYIISDDTTINNPYFYMTRRQFDLPEGDVKNLVSIGGGSVVLLEDRMNYARDAEYTHDAEEQIEEFVRNVLDPNGESKREYHFKWHGLMGYTQNGVRLIGADPQNKSLLYNLGCNGVGLLPSIFGGKKISQILSGAKTEPSMFDPVHMKVS